ncbi:MAG: phosphopantothenoylcysteine decarboxylase [Isosphaeraceae bacterium]|nr:phosphopantothenoylcysteine decarboxylase [Isosphaeraceae bacterium]
MATICVTGGGTSAPIDDVRRITNVSTGRFAAALAESSLAAGDRVIHLRTPQAAAPFEQALRFDPAAPDLERESARVLEVGRRFRALSSRYEPRVLPNGTVGEYAHELESILRGEAVDVVFLAAAVSDYEPEPASGKLSSDAEELVIRCRRTQKVIRSVADWAPSAYRVGFKLLSDVSVERLVEVARASAIANRVDLVAANDFRTVREGRHTIHLVAPDEPGHETLEPGGDLATRLLERVRVRASARRSP